MQHCQTASRREAALAAEVDELREEVRQLRELLNPPVKLPAAWGLSPQQEKIVIGLARGQGRMLPTEHLLGVMYGPGHEHGPGCLHVAVMKIRRKADRHGLKVLQQYGGYFAMPPESCAAVWAALKVPAPLGKMGGGMRGEAPIGARAAPEQAAA